jgi:hypothetical protein
MICGPQVRQTCEQWVRRWARDRALTTRVADRLSVLTSAALGHGLLYGPRGVSVRLRWADLDRIRVDVRWHGCSEVSRSTVDSDDVEAIGALLDALTDTWGFGGGAPGWQWMLVDCRTCG